MTEIKETTSVTRRDFLPVDRANYDFMFDVGMFLVRSDDLVEMLTGKLMLMIINDWEKNTRAIPDAVISATYALAQQQQERMADYGPT